MSNEAQFYVVTHGHRDAYMATVHRAGCSYLKRAHNAKPKDYNPLDGDRFNHYQSCPRCKPCTTPQEQEAKQS